MLLKIMGTENLPDEDPRKTCTVFDNVRSVGMSRGPDGVGATLWVAFDGVDTAQEYYCLANAYLMNDNGKTIQSWSGIPISAAEANWPTPPDPI